MKRNKVLLELIQVSTDKVHRIKFFGAVNGDVLPDCAAISSIILIFIQHSRIMFLINFYSTKDTLT